MRNEKLRFLRLVVTALVLVVVILVLWWLLFAEKDNHIGVEVDTGIGNTPEQVQSIKAIGQWEFMSISDEELVDTVRKGLLRDDQLARIYYGTMRLGIDMSRIGIHSQGDTVSVDLPRIDLLDYDFIDEARTKAFYEQGRWTAADREALYQKARRQMLAHGLTAANRQAARQNGEAQLRRLLTSMGYNHIIIRWNN
jgi:hypothetical protein